MQTTSVQRHSFIHDGLTISYLEYKPATANNIPVILLHGFSMHAQSNWLDSGWFDKLAKQNRHVIAIDARGHGQSAKPYNNEAYPANLMVTDSLSLLTSKGISQADYIGFSMGARMATFAAIFAPQLVRNLVIGGLGISLVKGLSNSQVIADTLLADNLREVDGVIPRRFRRIAETQGNDLKALAHCILSSRQQISVEQLANLQCKTLVIAGEKDNIAGSVSELAELIPHSSAKIIPELTHFNAIFADSFQDACIDFVCNNDWFNNKLNCWLNGLI